VARGLETLSEIAKTCGVDRAPSVPEWALGTVLRRSITFATGVEDTRTFVAWVQAHTMTGDIRVHPARPQLSASVRLEDLDHKTLVVLASVEGGVATTSWKEATGLMNWTDWIGFQPYDKYPEPGVMRRIGDCMIEFAPSGMYVEDWRFQPSRQGVLAGLRLVSETDSAGVEKPRQGGLVIAGDHAIISLARRDELPEGVRAQDYVESASDPVAALHQVLDCSVDYITADAAETKIAISTDGRREGLPWTWGDRISQGVKPDLIIETVRDEPRVQSRLWQIESIEANRQFPLATAAPLEKLAWLQREADTLITPILGPMAEAALCA
jgi:hypothetical protein